MSKCLQLLLASLIFTISLQPAWAEHLLDIYWEAVAADPRIKEADARRQATQEVRPQARALLLPTLSGRGIRERNFDIDGRDANKSSFTTHTYSLNLTQPLFDQNARVQVRQAEPIVNQAEAEFVFAQHDLILRVAERYFAVLATLDTLTFVTADKNAIARQLEQAKRRFEVGLITITDVFEAQARFDLAVADEINARNDVSDALEALRELTGQQYQADRLYVLNEKAPFDPPDPLDPEAWVKKAMENNPQIVSAAFGVETARENINLQKSGHYPTLDLVASSFDQDSGLSKLDGNRVGVELNVPIYLGGAVVSRTREASFQHEASKQSLENRQREVIRRVRDSFRGLLAAISRIKALDQARISNESGLEATQAGFDVGTRTIVDVLDAQRDLFLARRDYSVSRYDYILNYLNLRQATGQIDVQDLEAINVWLQEQKLPAQ